MKNHQLLLFGLLAILGVLSFVAVKTKVMNEPINTPVLAQIQNFMGGVSEKRDTDSIDNPIIAPIVGPPASDEINAPPSWDETDYSLDEAMKLAKERNQFVFVIFHATWCGPCKSFKAFTIDDNRTREALHPYIRARVDINQDRKSSQKYKVRSVPTYLILDKDGNIIKKGLGNKGVDEFLRWLSEKNTIRKLDYRRFAPFR